ncbi:hypothetical protein SEA_FORZA_96 [Gordonia phage Forza]|uniref:Uncharacterized protein n=1 Tax=Gordonia phage Forza TaxID=2571247 RepID=A0A650EZ31_9CAUD|nr:hypothetical protein PP303_gp096 [Gordonia phage Forza]QEM41563.1 hypothetical protein SEA_BOOPY_96 [Gordonia phage Boopy]QGT55089.1 hypothetical protein SEA_FORZA_96 [Gordonia phage Forza]UXE04237.1 hypothetical protein SEA_BLUENGOLD_95 [Gordonia phage BlueNGold]WBF03877.1 tail assembly chaperone [Gordonia phage Mareelih]
MDFVWNEANFDYMFHSWNGPTGHYLKGRIRLLEQLARMQIGIRTGAAKASIETHYGHRGKALEARVGPNARMADTMRNRGYAYWHHEGTLPHLITANKAKALRYYAAGAPVFAHTVHHPGTKPNHYLTQPMNEVF